MNNSTNLGFELAHEVLHNPPSAAVPSNLSDRWLDTALQGAERLVQGDEEADPELVHVPVNLVLHLLSEELRSGTLVMSDRKLLDYVAHYRIELAMEKLRRWGVVLAPAADKMAIFGLPMVKGTSKKNSRRRAK